MTKYFDIAIVGAGVFGAWTAWHLTRRGQRVLLLDAYGPANARASSAGESRIIRMGYGADEIYTQWAQRAYAQWQDFFASHGHRDLFHKTGVLWLAAETEKSLERHCQTRLSLWRPQRTVETPRCRPRLRGSSRAMSRFERSMNYSRQTTDAR